MLSTLHAVDQMKAWVPCSLLSLSMVPFATVSLGIGAVSWVVPKTVFVKMDSCLYQAYMRLCLFVFENLSGVQISLYGDIRAIREKSERALVLSNHQTNVDWAVVTSLSARQSENGSERGFRVMVKHAIHYVPLFGWYIFQHGYIYVRRFGDFVGAPVHRQLAWLDSLPEPFWLLIFPEGTRFNTKRPKLIEDTRKYCEKMGVPPLRNVLSPRAGGLQMGLDNLRTLDAVYDVTIAYEQTRLPNRHGRAPGMFEFVCGGLARRLHIHVKRFPVNDLPREKEELKRWIMERYQHKDKMLDQFYESGELSDLVQNDAPAISIYRSLPPTLFFVGALIAPIYSEKVGFVFPFTVLMVRTTYLCTIASFPLLIGWLHLRKCV